MNAQPETPINLPSETAAVQLADTFRLLGDPTRLRIIFACLNDPISVGEIATELDISPSLVSHHLRLLRAARLLRAQRDGKQVFYALLDGHIRCVIDDMITHVSETPDIEIAG